MKPSPTAGRLLLLLTAVLFSTGGAAIKATSLSSWQVAGFRSLIAAAALLAFLPSARRNWSPRVFLVAVACAATFILFVLANKLTTSANAIFLQSTAPLYLLLLGPLLLRERIGRGDLLFSLPALAGLALIFVHPQGALATAPDPFRGNILGVLSGLAWAFTIAGLRWMGTAGSASLATVAAGNLIAALFCLPMDWPPGMGAADLLILLYLGIVQIGLAYVCMSWGIRQVSAFEASILLMLEPGLNPVWTWLVHGERPTGWAIAGGALIVAATIANTGWHSRRSRPCRAATVRER